MKKLKVKIILTYISIIITLSCKQDIGSQLDSENLSIKSKINRRSSMIGDFEYSNYDSGIEITKYHGNSSTVVIPNRIYGKMVVRIGVEAFMGISELEYVIIPSSVNEIGDFAFLNTGLVEVNIPYCVESLGSSVFADNRNLKIARIFSEDLLYLSIGTFSGCTALESVKIPNSLETIGTYAFKDCENLSYIEVEDPYDLTSLSLDSIEIGAFMNCKNLRNLVIPPSVEAIKDYAFYGSGINELVFLKESDFDYYYRWKKSLIGLDYITIIKVPSNSIETYKSIYPDYEDIITGL